MHSEITAAGLLSRLDKGEPLNILDVREEIEYHTFNIGGKNIPLHAIKEGSGNIGFFKTDEIIVVCSAGLRSLTAAKLLDEAGYTSVYNLTGGLRALQKLRH